MSQGYAKVIFKILKIIIGRVKDYLTIILTLICIEWVSGSQAMYFRQPNLTEKCQKTKISLITPFSC